MIISHFSQAEFLFSDTANKIDDNNFPTWEITHNLERLAITMELIRSGLGAKPVTILSGYRSPVVNAEVGGATNSAHLYGLACDFVVPNYGTPLDVCNAIAPHLKFLQIDQLIWEFSDWVHLGLAIDGEPRYQCLTIDEMGTRNGFC